MRRTPIVHPIAGSSQATVVPAEAEPALRVVTVYQDLVTHQWTEELWDRVAKLVGSGGISRRCWHIGELTKPETFLVSVQAAGKADVLVVSVRDGGEMPMSLYVWIDAWLPNRVEGQGALVALIGVPSRPDAQSGRAHTYLESVARRAGLEFLPQERKLPPTSPSLTRLRANKSLARLALQWASGTLSLGNGSCAHWGFTE